MNYKDTPYFHVAHARDLEGKDRVLYRFLELIPGALMWGTFILVILLSFYLPVWAAIFIIAFDLYWLLKTIHLSYHHYHNWQRMKHYKALDWGEKLSEFNYDHIYHMVLLPFYQEGLEVVEGTMKSLLNSRYDKKKMIIVLGVEERAGEEALEIANLMKEKYGDEFFELLVSVHPKDIPGEIKGKGPNITYMAQKTKEEVVDKQNIPHEDILVSAFDIDTVVGDQYFSCLTWHFMTTEDPINASYQPVPLYNNNVWDTPAISRVAAMTATFWQMIQQERPEKLVTFSSHSLSFKSLHDAGYWQKNMISDDSRIFWNIYFHKKGNYRVVPISYPVSMDANLAPTMLQTFKNIYRQHLRWMWGAAENIPYMLFGFIKNKEISFREKVRHTIIQVEGAWSMATNPIMILVLGWLPILVGGAAFRDTVLSYNLPNITRDLMTIATMGLILSAVIAASLLPKVPKKVKNVKRAKVAMTLQWLLVPFTIILFGSIPAIHSATKLMIGRYMGEFWVTPKFRKKDAAA
jgi:cellulose synthase/poly-beta-1,6-N-acetylglucosamine synthase-like glycosyltransferase